MDDKLLFPYICFLISGSMIPICDSDSCSEEKQLRIYSEEVGCSSTPRVVPLSLSSFQDERVSRIIPGYVFVDRCSGSCDSLECLPTRKENMSVSVMVVLTTFGSGEWNTRCARINVEKHIGCSCSCPEGERTACQGRPEVYFEAESCRCKCRDREARRRCLSSGGKIWNERTCGCICPPESWRPCGTGYSFDYRDTCSCVRAYDLASGNYTTLIFAGIAVASMSLAATLIIVTKRRQRMAIETRRSSLRRLLKEAFGSAESLRGS